MMVLGIMTEFSKIDVLHQNASVLGVYGIAGVGKSTLCTILVHFLRRQFQGRACHLKLGNGDNSTLKAQIKALQQLTGADHDYLHKYINGKEEGLTCLIERMPRQRVFLALDNVSDTKESLEVARMFLDKLKYHDDSRVLVTSRSKDVLQKCLGISYCMHCPQITEEEAFKLVLDHLNLLQVGDLTKEQRGILEKLVDTCNFGGFHPMALKVLASQLGRNPSSWKSSDLQILEASDKEHVMFTSMETSFLRLPDPQAKDMFMDVALFTPEIVYNVDDLCLWLRDTLHPSCSDLNHVKRKLEVLRLKSLLEAWSTDSDNVCVHDLHRELAKRMARVEAANDTSPPRFIYQIGGEVTPTEILHKSLARCIERACLVNASFTDLAFEVCSSLKLLSLRGCLNLATLAICCLRNLVSLELSGCSLETLNLKGLSRLRWMSVISCKNLKGLNASDCGRLKCVYLSKCPQLEVLRLADSKALESVSVSYNDNLQHVDLGSGNCLCQLTLWFCEGLTHVEMSESVCLSEFKKRGCPGLMNIHGCRRMSQDVKCLLLTRWQKVCEETRTALEGSRNLQVLDLWDCPMSRLPNLRQCSSLRELKLSDVDVLLNSNDRALLHEYVDILCAADDDLALPTSLQDVVIGGCRNTVVKEMCWKLHGLPNLLVLSMQRVRVSWDWELYRSNSKAYSPNLYAGDNTTWNMESKKQLLQEEVHKELGCDVRSDEEERFSDEEIDSDSGGEMRDDDGEMRGEVSSFKQVEQNNVHEKSTHVKYLYHVIYWIREFLGEGTMQNLVKNILDKNVQLPLKDFEDMGECWVQLVMSDAMKQLHYKSPDYVCLEMFNNLNTLWNFIMQRATIHGVSEHLYRCELTSSRIRDKGTFEVLEELTYRELMQQLSLVRALGPDGRQSFHLQPWEEKVMEAIFFFEHTVGNAEEGEMMWERYGGDGIYFSSSRVAAFAKRLHSLIEIRHWRQEMFTVAGETRDGTERCKQEWLQSCKVCMSMQLLSAILVRVEAVEEELSLHRQWLDAMMQEINCLLESEIKGLFNHFNERSLNDLLRAWKVRQWLQNLALTISKEKIASTLTSEFPGVASTSTRNIWKACVLLQNIALNIWKACEIASTLIRDIERTDADMGPQKEQEPKNEDFTHELASFKLTEMWLSRDLSILSDWVLERFKQRGGLLHPSSNCEKAAFYDVFHHIETMVLVEQQKLRAVIWQLSDEPLFTNLVWAVYRMTLISLRNVEHVLLCFDPKSDTLSHLGEKLQRVMGPGIMKKYVESSIIKYKLESVENKAPPPQNALQIWARQVKFPLLQRTWDDVNQQTHVLPIRSGLRHIRIPNALLAVPAEYCLTAKHFNRETFVRNA